MFISTYRLHMTQRAILEQRFGCPVFDRYNVVLQIFQRHARTKEAKLQVALAEIPYLMARLNEDISFELLNKHSKRRLGKDHFEKHEMQLKRRQTKIKSSVSDRNGDSDWS